MKTVTQLLTVVEAAARLSELRGTSVSPRMVRRMTTAKRRRLPTVWIGRYLYVANLDVWLAAQIDPEDVGSVQTVQAETATPRRSRRSVRARTQAKGARRFGTPARGVMQFPSERRAG